MGQYSWRDVRRRRDGRSAALHALAGTGCRHPPEVTPILVLEFVALQGLQSTLRQLPQRDVVHSTQVSRDSVDVDLICYCQDVSKICFTAAMELCRDEDCPIDDSARRRHCPAAYLLLVAVIVQGVEGPLCLRPATPEAIIKRSKPIGYHGVSRFSYSITSR